MRQESFQKNRRLLKRADFEEVFSASRRRSVGGKLQKGCFALYWRSSEEPARLGMSVSKKILRSAVQRNRLKRCLREYFRKLPQSCQGDFILRLVRRPHEISVAALRQDLENFRSHLKGCED